MNREEYEALELKDRLLIEVLGQLVIEVRRLADVAVGAE